MDLTNKTVSVCSSHFKSLNTIDYKKIFPKTAIGNVCRFQILLCALSILSEIVWICLSSSMINSPYHDHIHFTGIGIWCGIFGTVSASFGLWIRTKPTKCNINVFMVLCVINGIFYLAFLSLSVVKATTIYNGPLGEYAVRTTMIVVHFIVGINQEAFLVASIIYTYKAISSMHASIENTYFLKPIINKEGEEVFQLVPAKIDIELEQPRVEQTTHSSLENCENGTIVDASLELHCNTENWD